MAETEYQRQYREKNKERLAVYREWYIATHPEYREKARVRATQWAEKNRKRQRDNAKVRYDKANPTERTTAQRKAILKMRYRITPEQYDAMFQAQHGVCAICGRPPKRLRLAVDHCHVTGTVRGLLCHPCNRLVGHLNDDPVKFRRGAEYLDVNGS